MTAHEILGVPEGATKEQIKRAYRKKAFEYHPDKNSSDVAQEKFIEVTEAYEELIEGKRQRKSQSNTRAYTYEEIMELRRRAFRERAEYYANLRYEEFLKETDAFKRAWYYWPVVFFVGLVSLIFFSLGSICCIMPIYKFLKGDASALIGIFLIPLGLLLLRSAYDTYIHFKPYIREKDFVHKSENTEDSEDTEETESINSTGNKKSFSIRNIKLPPVYFSEYKISKVLLFLPLIFSLSFITDWALPSVTGTEIIQYYTSTIDGGRHGKYYILEYHTNNFVFQPRDYDAKEGDRITVYYTPLFKTLLKYDYI